VVARAGGQEQVNFQVPFETAGSSNAMVAVSRSGQSSAAVPVPVLAAQPAVYAILHNQGYTPVSSSHPLVRGEYGFVYATGLGAVVNQPANGNAAPSAPPSSTQAEVKVTLAGIPCDVPYAGLAPGLAGIYQVNFLVPANAASGMQDLVIATQGASSPVVKVPVQ
jgi:uncharacterized protein (TIGR03437 family)